MLLIISIVVVATKKPTNKKVSETETTSVSVNTETETKGTKENSKEETKKETKETKETTKEKSEAKTSTVGSVSTKTTETTTEVSVKTDSTNPLPSTGPEDALMAAVAFGLLTTSVTAYIISKREVQKRVA